MRKHKKGDVTNVVHGYKLKEEENEGEGCDYFERVRRPLAELKESQAFTTSINPPKRLIDIGVPEKLIRMVIDICLIIEKSRSSTADMFFFLFNNNSKKTKKKLSKKEIEQMDHLLELLEYIQNGNKHQVGKFIRYFREEFQPFEFNNLAVVAACAYGQVELIKYFESLSSHVNASVCKDIGIISAGRRGHLDVIKYLIKDHRVDITARNNALVINAMYGLHLDIVKFLLQQRDSQVSITSRDFEVFKFVGRQGNIELIDHFLNEYQQDEMDNTIRFGNVLVECSENNHLYALEHLFEVEDEKKEFVDDERIFTSAWINRSFVRSAEQGHVECVKLYTTNSKTESDLTKNGVKKALFGSIRNKRKEVLVYFLCADENDELSPRLKDIIKDILKDDFLEILRLLNENKIDLEAELLIKILELGLSTIEKNWASLGSTLSSLRNFLPSTELTEAVIRLFGDLLLLSEEEGNIPDEEFKRNYCDLLSNLLEGDEAFKYISFVRLTLSRWVGESKKGGVENEIFSDTVKKFGEYIDSVKSFDNEEDQRIFGKYKLVDRISLLDRETGDYLNEKNILCDKDFDFLVHLKNGVVWAQTREDYWDRPLRNVPFLYEELALAIIKIYKKKENEEDPYGDENIVDVVCQLIWTEDDGESRKLIEALLDGPIDLPRLEQYEEHKKRIEMNVHEKERVDRKIYIDRFIPDLETVLSEEVFKGSEYQNLDFNNLRKGELPYGFLNQQKMEEKEEEQQKEEQKEEVEGEEYNDDDLDDNNNNNTAIVHLCPSFRLNLEGFLGNLEDQKSRYESHIEEFIRNFPSKTTTSFEFLKDFLRSPTPEVVSSYYMNSLCFQNYDLEVIDSLFTFLSSTNEKTTKVFYETGLKMASENGFLDILKLLLMNNDDLDLSVSKSYPFRMACKNGHVEIIEFLINFYSNFSADDPPFNPFENENEALLNCARYGYSEILQIILNCESIHKKIISDNEKILIHRLAVTALQYEQNEILELLGEKFSEKLINWELIKEEKITTAESLFNALKLACLNLEEEIVEEFIEMDESTSRRFFAFSPHQISILLGIVEAEKPELIEFLLMTYNNNDDDNNNSVTRCNNYLFRWACSCGHVTIAKFLMKNFGNVIDASDMQNESIIFASRWGNNEIVKLLMKNSGNVVDASSRNNLSVEYACERGHAGIVEMLISKCEDVRNNYVVEQMSDQRIEEYIIQKYNSSLELRHVCSNNNTTPKLLDMKLRTVSKDRFSNTFKKQKQQIKEYEDDDDDDDYYEQKQQEEKEEVKESLSWYSGSYGIWYKRSMLLECSSIKFVDYETLLKNEEDWFYFSNIVIRRIYKLEKNEDDDNKLQFIQQSKKTILSFIEQEKKKNNDNNEQQQHQQHAWLFVMGERKGFELEESLLNGYVYSSEILHQWISNEIEPEIEKLKEWAKLNEIVVVEDDEDDEQEQNNEESYYVAKCEEWVENKYGFLNIRFDADIIGWNSDDDEDGGDNDNLQEDRKKIEM